MNNEEYSMGWLRDYPDFRDYTMKKDKVAPKHQLLGETISIHDMLAETGVTKASQSKLPAAVDLRKWCSPIEHQGQIGSCTAHACVGLVEFFENKAFGKHIDASRLFIYKTTRKLLRWTGDTGAYLRTTMAALAMFGVPPEKYWSYTDDGYDYDEEPPAFCYALAHNYKAIQYYRLDPPGMTEKKLLNQIKAHLAAQLPSMFGFTVYQSISQARPTGKIPFPHGANDHVDGGHAVVAVGYDDKMEIKNALPGSTKTTGAFLIRNSWGTSWGDGGYGWLPYDYVLSGLAVDWWSLLKNQWIDTGAFGL
ncbi:MAG: cysteine protease [Ardenticatenaceae bacterium]|nr:cysteine protease [Ardenticatenaceae bacterium]